MDEEMQVKLMSLSTELSRMSAPISSQMSQQFLSQQVCLYWPVVACRWTAQNVETVNILTGALWTFMFPENETVDYECLSTCKLT